MFENRSMFTSYYMLALFVFVHTRKEKTFRIKHRALLRIKFLDYGP